MDWEVAEAYDHSFTIMYERWLQWAICMIEAYMLMRQGILVEAKDSSTRLDQQVAVYDAAQKRYLGHK